MRRLLKPRLVSVFLAFIVGTFGAPPAAHAANFCLENNVLTFSPPLEVGDRFGTVTIEYETTCADAPGLVGSQHDGTVSLPYFGSCALVHLNEGIRSTVVAGTLYTIVSAVSTKVEVLQPDAPCPITTAHGTGVTSTAP